MKNMQKFLSLVLVLLLVTSCYVPAVSAEPAIVSATAEPAGIVILPFLPFLFPAVPATAEIIICGVTVVMSGAAALKIAENLGMTWDKTMKGWDQLMKDTGAALDNLIHAKRWVGITTDEGQAVMKAFYEY